MSDFSKDDLRDALAEALRNAGHTTIDTESLDDLMADLAKLDKQVNKNTSTYKGLIGEMLTGRRAYRDMSATIDSLDKKIEELGDATDNETAEKKKLLIQERQAIQLMQEHNAKQRAVITAITQFSKSVSTTAAKSIGNFATGLLEGSSAFTLAGGLMEGAMDTANAGMQAVGTAATTFGSTALASTTPKVQKLGGAAMIAGVGLQFLGTALTGIGKAGIQILVKELEKTVTAFQNVTRVGGTFAGGMDDIYGVATAAGVSVQQFAAVMDRNAQNLSQSGLGVAEGAKQMARVSKSFRENGGAVSKELIKLGYSVEEQNDLVAQSMANLRKTAGGMPTDRDVAQATREYASNLKLISAITGEDAKKKEAQMREENAILVFQQEMAKKTPAQRAEINQIMENMTAMERKNLRDRVAFQGSVINEEGAIYESVLAGAREKGEATYKLLDQNQLTVGRIIDLNAQYADQLRESGLGNEAVAKAGYALGGNLGNVSKSILESIDQSNIYTKEGIAAAKENVEEGKKASGRITEAYANAAVAAQNMAMRLQDEILPILGDFSDVATQIIQELSGEIKGAGFGKKSWWAEVKEAALERAGQGAVMAGVMGATIGAPTGPGAVVTGGGGAILGGAVGGAVGAAEGTYKWWRGDKDGEKPTQPSDKATQSRVRSSSDIMAERRQRFTQLPGFEGLNVKAPESVAGGKVDSELLKLAYAIQESYPGAMFTAFNDKFHQKGAHTSGNALDFTLPYWPDKDEAKLIMQDLKNMGFKTVLDEYNAPSEKATGGHIHAALKDGGITSGPSLAGEAGPEAVIPLPNGRTIPVEMDMSAMVDVLRDLLDVNKDNRDYLEKLFHASV